MPFNDDSVGVFSIGLGVLFKHNEALSNILIHLIVARPIISELPTRLQRRFRGESHKNLIDEGNLTPTTNIPSLAYIDLDDGTTESNELVERRTEGGYRSFNFRFS